MKNNNFLNFIRKNIFIFIILILYIFIPIFIFKLDISNIIRKNFPTISTKYDWLAFLGSYISLLGTLSIAIVSLMQNKSLSQINNKMMDNNLNLSKDRFLGENHSLIEFDNIQYLYNETLHDPVGFKLYSVNDNIKKDDDSIPQVRFILNVKELNNKVLKEFTISNLKIKSQNSDFQNFENINNLKEIVRKGYGRDNKNYWLTFICRSKDKSFIEEIYKGKNLILIFELTIYNMFNILTKIKVELNMNRMPKPADNSFNSDHIDCISTTNNIEFKDINYTKIKATK